VNKGEEEREKGENEVVFRDKEVGIEFPSFFFFP
jgi:hypothetical protein